MTPARQPSGYGGEREERKVVGRKKLKQKQETRRKEALNIKASEPVSCRRPPDRAKGKLHSRSLEEKKD